MANYNNITASWESGTLSERMISRQFDDAATLVSFAGIPAGEDPDAIYHLIVWMATEEGGEPAEQSPIQLSGPEWLISNYYTQFQQSIQFQLCIQIDGDDGYEAHSPIFSGRIGKSLRHDGETVDIDTATMFDPYKEYVDERVNELIVAAGDIQIDTSLSVSGAAADAKAVGDALSDTNERLGDLSNLNTTDKTDLVSAINEAASTGGGGGQPIPVSLASQMDTEQEDALYLYIGNEEGYEYGYIYAYQNGAFAPTTLYGRGQNGADGADGADGEDGYSPTASVTQTATGATITVTDKNGTTTAQVENGTATDAQVAAWLDEHPEATTTVEDGAITVAKLSDDVLGMIEDVDGDELTAPYYYPSYTSGTLNNDGTVNTSGTGNVTDYLPVKAGETLTLSSNLAGKIGYYTDAKVFIPSLVSVTTGLNDYVVPATAAYARFQCGYQRSAVPLSIRKRTAPKNKSLFDLIFSPIKSRPSINIAGDSNTYGYGLSNRTTEAWSYLLANELANITKVAFSPESEWVEALGVIKYSASFNAMTYAQMSIWTDATSVTLGYSNSYSGKWTWFIDDVQSGDAGTTATTLTLDGNYHKVTVRVTGGQVVSPRFEIPKAITVVNSATSGVGPANFVWEAGHDWLLVMIGTNGRSGRWIELRTDLYEYRGKGTYIIPFPNHKSDSSYTYSELYTYASLKKCFEEIGFETLNLSDIAGNLFYDNSAYQSDLIHFNAVGHRYIANAISGALGMPLYLKTLS